MELPPFQMLVDAHGRAVHHFLIATVGASDADDCYQETWLAALRAYPRLRDASNLRGWIMTVAHNKAMDHLRARRRRALPDSDGLALATAVAPAGAPGPGGAAVDAVGALDGVWIRVGALPPKQRAALALRFILDAEYGEISAAMGTSPEAARRNVHEGLKRLRRELVP